MKILNGKEHGTRKTEMFLWKIKGTKEYYEKKAFSNCASVGFDKRPEKSKTGVELLEQQNHEK